MCYSGYITISNLKSADYIRALCVFGTSGAKSSPAKHAPDPCPLEFVTGLLTSLTILYSGTHYFAAAGGFTWMGVNEEVNRKRIQMKVRNLGVGAGILMFALSLTAAASTSDQSVSPIEKKVSHELNMLPYSNVFDYMTFSVDQNGKVTLNGKVTNPVLKSDAAKVVKRVEGVELVENDIQVLPVSFFDDGLRARLYRTIYGYGPLQRYSLGVNKPIRIIVQNGHVTLLGVVATEFDKNIAGMRANSVAGAFSVDNQLRVVKG